MNDTIKDAGMGLGGLLLALTGGGLAGVGPLAGMLASAPAAPAVAAASPTLSSVLGPALTASGIGQMTNAAVNPPKTTKEPGQPVQPPGMGSIMGMFPAQGGQSMYGGWA